MNSYAGLGGGGGLGLMGLNMAMNHPSRHHSSRRAKRKSMGNGGTKAHALKGETLQTEAHGLRGEGSTTDTVFHWKNGKQYLAHSPQEAPYPRSYDRIAIDHDTTDHLFLTQACNGITWHELDAESGEFPSLSSSLNKEHQSEASKSTTDTGRIQWKPNRVLDLGCGNGVWTLDAAEVWPDTLFVGLDIAPIQPSLSLLVPKLASRIRWVNANFLEPLPFPTSYFDFVHIRRIARGVPEHKWDELLQEVSRVLTPNGALEILEEDLIFPGSGAERRIYRSPSDVQAKRGAGVFLGSSSPRSISNSSNASTIQYRISHSLLEQAYKNMHADRRINLHPISILNNILPTYFHEVRAHPPVLMTFPPPEEEIWSDSSSYSSASDSDASYRSRGSSRTRGEETRRRVTYRGSTISRLSTIASSIAYSIGSSAVPSSAGNSPSALSHLELQPDAVHEGALHNDGGPLSPSISISRDQQSLTKDQDTSHTIALLHPPNKETKPDAAARGPKAPSADPTFNSDLQSLTLSLALSVTDVLECKESIWDYILQSSRTDTSKQSSSSHETSIEDNDTHDTIHDGNETEGTDASSRPHLSVDTAASDRHLVDREEFDRWFINYEEEMHGRLQLAKALQSRLNWRTRELASAGRGVATPLSSSIPHSHWVASTQKDQEPSPVVAEAARSRNLVHQEWPFVHSDLSLEDRYMQFSPFFHSSSTSLWYEDGDNFGSEEPVDSSPDIFSQHRSERKDKTSLGSYSTPQSYSQTSQHPPLRRQASDSKLRTHSRGLGEYHPRRLRGGHSRGLSLDAANAWKLLAQEKTHLGSLSSSPKGITGLSRVVKPVPKHKRHAWDEHLPGLSRCVKVFVARNNKAE